MLLKLTRIVTRQEKNEAGEVVKQRSDEVFYIRADEIVGLCQEKEGIGLILKNGSYVIVAADAETILSGLNQCGIKPLVIDLMPS
jgi:hypothetical protein